MRGITGNRGILHSTDRSWAPHCDIAHGFAHSIGKNGDGVMTGRN
jgi:hypothetical protein